MLRCRSRKRRHLFILTKYCRQGAAENEFVFGGLFLRLGGFMKACSFFGYRDTAQTEELKQKVREIVERLIVEEEVDTFLFGSRSKFDELCHMVVTEFQEKYPKIRRVAYLCKHETVSLAGAGIELKRKIKELTGRDIYVAEYEEIKKSDRVNSAGRASYVERNQWMIDESERVVFFIDGVYQTGKSGTIKSAKYAKMKNKKCICMSLLGVIENNLI